MQNIFYLMEKRQQTEKIKYEPHLRTQYNKWSGAFGIQLGKPVKLPNLKRTILNTSRQQLQERQKNFLSLEKDKENQKNRRQILPRFTSQQSGLVEEEKTEFFPKINKKLMKQTSNQRLQRIKSEQKIVNQNFQMVGTYRIGGIIGKGSYATVRLAKGWKGGSFAMKIYDRNKLNDPTQKKNIQNEIQIMEKISHPNIIKYYETIDSPQSINIVMELVENSSLVEFLHSQKEKKASQEDTKIIMKDLLKALAYLQTKNIVHRDLKFENILLSKDMKLKLIDFGFSTFSNQIHYDFCGTLHYISPQIISKGGYLGPSADIWAVGIIMYKLLTGTFPFRGMNDKILCRKICRGQYAEPTNISKQAKDLITRMLNSDAGERPTAAQILRNSWFSTTQSI